MNIAASAKSDSASASADAEWTETYEEAVGHAMDASALAREMVSYLIVLVSIGAAWFISHVLFHIGVTG